MHAAPVVEDLHKATNEHRGDKKTAATEGKNRGRSVNNTCKKEARAQSGVQYAPERAPTNEVVAAHPSERVTALLHGLDDLELECVMQAISTFKK